MGNIKKLLVSMIVCLTLIGTGVTANVLNNGSPVTIVEAKAKKKSSKKTKKKTSKKKKSTKKTSKKKKSTKKSSKKKSTKKVTYKTVKYKKKVKVRYKSKGKWKTKYVWKTYTKKVKVTSSAKSSTTKITTPAKTTPANTTPVNTNKKVVVIDAGHQARGDSSLEPDGPGSSTKKAKVTTGATGVVTRKAESQINLEVALKLRDILASRGYSVIMCRTSQNVNISNSQRAAIANNNNAGAFIRLHCDSSTNSNATGATGIGPATGNKYLSASLVSESQRLTQSVMNGFKAATGAATRANSYRNDLSGINWSKVPVTLVEMGFISNPTEDRNLANSSYQTKVATGIANGIQAYLG